MFICCKLFILWTFFCFGYRSDIEVLSFLISAVERNFEGDCRRPYWIFRPKICINLKKHNIISKHSLIWLSKIASSCSLAPTLTTATISSTVTISFTTTWFTSLIVIFAQLFITFRFFCRFFIARLSNTALMLAFTAFAIKIRVSIRKNFIPSSLARVAESPFCF